ncbi:hypothetical protein CIHG_06840 [Coccidioides immitis H538.4]|uniref:Uncharacterized protein n=1 Tax=Coccidioides immitis H538.4 TaxID=396776 RepID=A0A0J8UNA9_COCIT|nr:hypothetical protein CIHG_06840 [Coccidioides immitis H538.4]
MDHIKSSRFDARSGKDRPLAPEGKIDGVLSGDRSGKEQTEVFIVGWGGKRDFHNEGLRNGKPGKRAKTKKKKKDERDEARSAKGRERETSDCCLWRRDGMGWDERRGKNERRKWTGKMRVEEDAREGPLRA